jgi:hypothetical protein
MKVPVPIAQRKALAHTKEMSMEDMELHLAFILTMVRLLVS